MNPSNDNKTSLAQIEVWNWKQSIHDEIKDMEVADGLRYILEKAKKGMDEQIRLKDKNENAA